MKIKYKKPKIRKSEIKINYFFSTQRQSDSMGMPMSSYLLAQASWNCVDTCFLKGTQITVDKDKTLPIEDLAEGDQVVSYNVISNEMSYNKVSKKIQRSYDKGYFLINSTLKITPLHPVWIKSKRWVKAKDLIIGDFALSFDNTYIQIISIRHIQGLHEVYNIHLPNSEHNFFAENILVHNQTYDCY